MNIDRATDIRRGFDHGNFANAYETTELTEMLDAIEDQSDDYRTAATIAFFGSYELNEIPGDAIEAFQEAWFSDVGKHCLAQGYFDVRPQAEWEAL